MNDIFHATGSAIMLFLLLSAKYSMAGQCSPYLCNTGVYMQNFMNRLICCPMARMCCPGQNYIGGDGQTPVNQIEQPSNQYPNNQQQPAESEQESNYYQQWPTPKPQLRPPPGFMPIPTYPPQYYWQGGQWGNGGWRPTEKPPLKPPAPITYRPPTGQIGGSINQGNLPVDSNGEYDPFQQGTGTSGWNNQGTGWNGQGSGGSGQTWNGNYPNGWTGQQWGQQGQQGQQGHQSNQWSGGQIPTNPNQLTGGTGVNSNSGANAWSGGQSAEERPDWSKNTSKDNDKPKEFIIQQQQEEIPDVQMQEEEPENKMTTRKPTNEVTTKPATTEPFEENTTEEPGQESTTPKSKTTVAVSTERTSSTTANTTEAIEIDVGTPPSPPSNSNSSSSSSP